MMFGRASTPSGQATRKQARLQNECATAPTNDQYPPFFSKNGGTKYRSGDIPVPSPFYYRLAKGADTVGRQMFFLNKRLAAVLFFAGLISLGQAATAELSRNVQYRGGLLNARIQFEPVSYTHLRAHET